jgi:hypothetical protein
MPAADALFATDYHEARARFLCALEDFERHVDRRFVGASHVVDAREDLSIDVAEMRPDEPRRVYVVISGIHGVEGFAGNAIQQALLASVLPYFDLDNSGIVLVHGLNPSGMFNKVRVNASNVDLNRNFSSDGMALYASDSSDYAKIAALLAPQAPYDDSMATRARFLAQIARAVARHGFAPLRQATLAGQYADPQGLFYGGAEPQPETDFFQAYYKDLCRRYPEVLLTDLHTGYGAFAQVSALFGRADSPDFARFTAAGVSDRRGRDQGYAARGDLVAYCQRTAKTTDPQIVFNGSVVELGTHGLGVAAQLQDLYTLVCENQVRHHGAVTPEAAMRARRAFAGLFNPENTGWRKQVVRGALECIQPLLVSRNFL